MELKINDFQTPAQILFNYDELKKEIQEKVNIYETMVYTDDQITEAKKDRASLNKLKKALNDERIRMEREYMKPFGDFKAKVNELIGIIDKPVKLIDKQVKGYEEQKQQEKMKEVKEYFESLEKPEWLTFESIAQERWGNASTTMRFIQDSIEGILCKIKNDLATLSEMPMFGFEAVEVYKQTLDMNKAITEGKRLVEIQRRKEAQEEQQRIEEEAKKQEEATPQAKQEVIAEVVPEMAKDEEKQWISFRALLTKDNAKELNLFFRERNITFEAI